MSDIADIVMGNTVVDTSTDVADIVMGTPKEKGGKTNIKRSYPPYSELEPKKVQGVNQPTPTQQKKVATTQRTEADSPVKMVKLPFGSMPMVEEVEQNPNQIFEGAMNVIRGGRQAIVDLGDFVGEVYDAYKSGNVNKMTSLGSAALTGGLVTVDPSKRIGEGAVTSETGRNIVEAGKSLLEGKPLDASYDLAEALPFIGPIIETANNYVKGGELGKGLGYALASGVAFKEIAPKRIIEPVRGKVAGAVDPYKQFPTSAKGKLTPQQVLDSSREVWKRQDEIKAGGTTLANVLNEVVARKVSENKTKETSAKVDEVVKVAEETKTPEEVQVVKDTLPEAQENSFRNHSTEAYRDNKSVAVNLDELREVLPDRTLKDVGVTTWSLVNDVNSWLDGNEVDIKNTREFLSDLATNAEEFRHRFIGQDYPQSFIDWKKTISEAADWARKQDRIKNVQSKMQMIDEALTSSGDVIAASKDWELMEKYYGKDFVELTDQEILDFAKNKKEFLNKQEAKKNETAKRVLAKKGKTVDELAGEIVGKIKEIEEKKKTPVQEKVAELSELDKLIQEQSEDMASDKIMTRISKVKKEKGPRLYSGIPVDLLAEEVTKLGSRVADYVEKAGKMKVPSFKESFKTGKEEGVRAIIDKSGNIRRELLKIGDRGYQVVRQMVLAKGSTAIAKAKMEQMRKEVYRGLSNDERKILDSVILSNRMVDIANSPSGKGFQFPEPIDAFHTYKALFHNKGINKLMDLTPEQATNIKQRAQAYFDWMRKPLKEMFDEGLISEQEFKDLSEHNYRRISSVNKPLKIEDLYDRKYENKDVKRTIYDSGIEHLSQGQSTDIYNPSSELMALEVFSRAYGRIMNNKANKTLLSLTRSMPENPFVRTKLEVPKPEGWMEVRYWDTKGNKRSIYIDPSVEQFKMFDGKEMNKTQSQALNEFIREDKSHKSTKLPYDKKSKIPSHWVRHFVFENGQKKSIHLHPEFSKEWTVLTKDVSPKVALLMKWLSGSPVTRMFATGIDVGFAMVNLPRDIHRLWTASRYYENGKWHSVYNPALPVYLPQIAIDLAKVLPDAILRKGRWNEYINEGGGMDFLVTQGSPFTKGKTLKGDVVYSKNFYEKAKNESAYAIDRITDALGYIGETSEIATRLAIRERTMKKGLSAVDATFAARDYMDFSQGGYFTKALDNLIPYINSSVQGTRGFFRSFQPGSGTAVESWAKLGQFAGVVAGFYLTMKYAAPKTYEMTKSSQDGRNNIIIPWGEIAGVSVTDDNGQERFPYFKLPIDQGQRFFKKLFEASIDKFYLNEEVDAEGTVSALKDLSPVDVTSAPPFWSAAFGYVTNLDTWKNKKISEQQFSYPTSAQEFTGDTPQMYIDTGKVTGLSPDRMKYMIDEITARSMYTDLAGRIYDRMFKDTPEETKQRHFADTLSKFPMSKRVVGLTSPASMLASEAKEVKESEILDKFVETRNLETHLDAYLKDKKYYPELMKFIRSQNDPDVRDRMMKQYEFVRGNKDLKFWSFWMTLKGMPSMEARARFYNVGKKKIESTYSPEEFYSDKRKVDASGGIFTKEFDRALEDLRFKESLESK